MVKKRLNNKETMTQIESLSAAATRALGANLSRFLTVGDVVLFFGGLGSGKTTMVQGIANALGASETALSPTFVLARTLTGAVPVHHIDFYRLKKKDVLSFGIEDYFTGGGEIPKGIVLIEWADRCREVWPKERLEVYLCVAPKIETRFLQIKGVGRRYQDMAVRFRRDL